jgi:hypothetical protein
VRAGSARCRRGNPRVTPVYHRLITVIREAPVTPGSATAAGSGDLEIERDIPLAEAETFFMNQFFAIAGMRRMTDPAGTALPAIDNVNIMKVAFTIAEIGIDGRFGKAEQALVVTFETEIVDPVLVRSVEGLRIRTGQKAEVTGTMGIVASGALAGLQRTMHIFFTFQFVPDVFQRRSAKVIGAMTTEAELFFARRQQPFRF